MIDIRLEFRFANSTEWFQSPENDPHLAARHAARLHGGARIGQYIRRQGTTFTVKDHRAAKSRVVVTVRERHQPTNPIKNQP